MKGFFLAAALCGGYHWIMHKSSAQIISIGVFILGLAAMGLVAFWGYSQWSGGRSGEGAGAAQEESTDSQTSSSSSRGFFDRFGGLEVAGVWESETQGEEAQGRTTFIAYDHEGQPAYDLYFVPREPGQPVYYVRGTYEYDRELDELRLTPRQDMGTPENHTERIMKHLGMRPYAVKIRKGKSDSMIWVPQKPRGHIDRTHPLFAYMHVPKEGQIIWHKPQR